MGEYIKGQPAATSAANGDYFVFDTTTETYKITRANLLGQMDTNAVNIATNVADIADNVSDIATNTADIATNTASIAALGLEWISIDVITSELLNLNTSPKKLLDLAPSSSIDLLDVSFYYRYNSAAFVSGGQLSITTNGAEIANIEDTIYTGAANTYGKALGVVPATFATWGDIFLTADTSNPTTGDGSITINILYRRIS